MSLEPSEAAAGRVRGCRQQGTRAAHGSSSRLRAAISRRLSRASVPDSPETSRGSHAHLEECSKLIEDLNSQVAHFRDMLISIGKAQDCPEVRDKIRTHRKKCVDTCSSANHLLMPDIRSDVAEGIPVDSQHLVNLVCCTQLLLRELKKCRHLISANPMDMSSFFAEQKAGQPGMGVLEMLVLWRPPPVDFQQDELRTTDRDIQSVLGMLSEMQEFMPVESNCKSLIDDSIFKWKQRSHRQQVYKHLNDWCCICRSNIT